MNKTRKSFKSLLALVCVAALFMGTLSTLAACGGKQSISFENDALTVYAGDVVTIKYSVTPEDADITWASSNKSVATVNKSGRVVTLAKGTTVISATLDGGAAAECVVTVLDRTVTISETTKTVNLEETKTITLTATDSATNSGNGITWQSSNPSVATVAGGVVTFGKAIARESTVTITASAGIAKATCEITVVDNRIPEDYYVLTKETNANVVAHPGVWYYHADGAENTNYRFTEDGAPSFGGGLLSAELDIFPILADGKYFRFRYQPDYEEGTKYTLKFTVKMNIDCTLGFGTASTFGGVNTQQVTAGTSKQIIYIGTVNTGEPFHINVNKLNLADGAELGNVKFEITNILIKEYETGDENDITVDIPTTPLPDEYDLVRGSTGDACTNQGKWYYMIDPVSAGASDFSEAKYDHGTVTLALNPNLTGQYHQVRVQPRIQLNTRVEAEFTVSVSAPAKITFGKNNTSSARTAVVFGTELSEEDEANGVELYAVGEEVTLKKIFVVGNNDPFVIAIVPDDTAEACVMVVKDVTFTEKPYASFTVTFDVNGGNELANSTVTVAEESSIDTLPTPTKDGAVFAGWYDNENCTGTAITAPYTPDSSVTLFAKWESASNVYTVTYDSKGGSEIAAVNVPKGENTTLATVTRTGYVFDGWYESEGYTGDKLSAGAAYTPSENITLYAKWLQEYTVTFNTNTNGTTVAAKTVVEGNSVTVDALSRGGYDFGGWYDNSGLTGTAISGTYTPTSSVTLYAKWTAKTEYDIIKGDYGVVNKNRDTWYFNLQGAGTVTSATYNNGTVNLAVSGAELGYEGTSLKKAVQLRYLPDLPTGEEYTMTLTVTVSAAGKIKASLDNSGQSQEIAADTATTLTFKTTVEWNANDKLNRPFLVQFYPAAAGDVTINVTNISVTTRDVNNYELTSGLNSAVRNAPNRWFYYADDASTADKFAIGSATCVNGTVVVEFDTIINKSFQLRYSPCADNVTKKYNVTFTVKIETTDTIADGVNIYDAITTSNGGTLTKVAGENGVYEFTCTGYTKTSGGNPFAIQLMTDKITSGTLTVSDIVFTEVA